MTAAKVALPLPAALLRWRPTVLDWSAMAAVVLAAGIVVASSTAGQGRPRAVAQPPICSEAIPNLPGKRMISVIVDFPPGGYSPPHTHGGSLTVYVLEGTIRSQLEGTPAQVFGPGQTFFEPMGIKHLLAENVSSTVPARILAVFVADEGAALTTYLE